MTPSRGFYPQMRKRSTAIVAAAIALCLFAGVASSVAAAPRRHLTFPRASREIRRAARQITPGRPVIAVAERLGPLRIEADVEWEGSGPGVRGCEALFFARLTPTGKVAVRHDPLECRLPLR
jgi:hypothetical protein